MSINFNIIGRRVRECRLHNHMSQAELAEHIDMSVAYISQIETAKKQASLESLVRISNVLGVTVDNLLNGNQKNDEYEYRIDLERLIEGCTSYEIRIIYEISYAIKKSLRENNWLQFRNTDAEISL